MTKNTQVRKKMKVPVPIRWGPRSEHLFYLIIS
jgi:hypothetical protein